MNRSDRLTVLRLILGGLAFLMAYTTLDLYRQTQALGVIFSPASEMLWLLILMSLGCVLELGGFFITFSRYRDDLLDFGHWLVSCLPREKSIVIISLCVLAFGFSVFVLFPPPAIWNYDALHWLTFGWVVTATLLLLRRLMPQSNWLNIFAVSLISIGAIYQCFQQVPLISTYPFSMMWSETSRYYYASLYFSERIYHTRVPLTPLHPTRYFMQSIPFWMGRLPLWFHRFWQVFLWLACPFGAAALLTRRLRIANKALRWIFLAWAFLFLWQGPVYYHLLVMVIIVLWGFDSGRFWRSLLVVLLASAWAGVSRVNWFPVPGMIATTLYFLEKPKGGTSLWKYLLPPVVWISMGVGTALGAQILFMRLSGNPVDAFTSSFSSDLLWYRLLPNPVYSLGVLAGTIMVSLPILFVIGLRLRNKNAGFHPVAGFGIASILTVLLVGGLVVSTKIGGGSNLHNLDAYLTLLLIFESYLYFGSPISASRRLVIRPEMAPAWMNFIIAFIPACLALSSTAYFSYHDPEIVANTLLKIQEVISGALDGDSEVLFIAERQLLTFGNVTGVELVPEYEQVYLMEMAMAGNRKYLDAFTEDIHSQRFDLIVTDSLFENYKKSSESWAEENNVWIDAVSVPVLCYYQQIASFPDPGIQVLAPLEKPKDCE